MPDKEINLSLTRAELRLLTEHWSDNLRYGVGGTFGDGDKITSKREFTLGRKLGMKLRNALASKNTHTVWWFEQDKFDGKQSRVYRDFTNFGDALEFSFKHNSEHVSKGTVAEIKDCPWHHSHA